jgi:hypothetical protein
MAEIGDTALWLAVAVLLALVGVWLVAVGVRVLVGEAQAAEWRRSLVGFELRLPRTVTTDDVARWLGTLWTLVPQRRRWSLLAHQPIGLETTADQHGIRHIVLVPGRWRTHVLSTLAAVLPGARLDELPAVSEHGRFRQAVQLRLRGAVELFAVERGEDTSRSLLASLQPLEAGEVVRVQWLVTGAPPPRYVTSTETEPNTVPVVWRSGPVLRAVCRIGVAAPAGRHRATAIFRRVWAAMSGMNTARTRIARAWWLPRAVVAARLTWRAFPAGRWPMALTTAEIAGLLGLVTGETGLPGVPAEISRALPLPSSIPATGLVIAGSNYPGTTAQLHVSTVDRLRHMWILGPTGTGKSTLLTNNISHDVAHGDGLVLIDPGGDLAADVCDRIPDNRVDDVIVIDPTHTDHIVGINPLTAGPSEQAAGFVYHVLQSIWAQSWGPRTADIVRAALLTLTATTAPGGSAFTLVDIPELLTNAAFRRYVTAQPLPPQVVTFWRWYDRMPEAQQLSIIAPVLNKLRTFTMSSTLRATLGQSTGVNFADVIARGRIVLVPLKKAILGDEVSALLGALVMASLWQAVQTRVNIPKEARTPFWLVADEFQETLRLPLNLEDMTARARSLGLVLAHQYLGQLPPPITSAILSTVRTHILFQLLLHDAKELAPAFAPLTAAELHHFGAFEIAARLCTNGATGPAITGRTYPAPNPTRNGAVLAAASREHHGLPIDDVDAHIAARVSPPATRSIGRWNRIPGGGEQP